MKDKAKEKIQKELNDWGYLKELKENISGFKLKKEMQEEDEFYYIFKYENEAKKRSVSAYFHEETMEYKISVAIGLTDFCDVTFFASNISEFEKLLRENFEKLIKKLSDENNEYISYLIGEKGILSWNFEEILPLNLEGFSLFITPKTPLETVNGSYILFDYSDFDINSNFTVYYNIFRNEFFGESKIAGAPTVTYDFDSKTLDELEKKLKANMENYLKEIRKLCERF